MKNVSYEYISTEYYNRILHPTCYNFRMASKIFLITELKKFTKVCRILETGAGLSLVGEIAHETGQHFGSVIISDISEAMLGYSIGWLKQHPVRYDVELLCSDAENLPLKESTFDVIISTLGDPYNSSDYWKECFRVLRDGGEVCFTTPSYEWAAKFRNKIELSGIHEAQFVLADGEYVTVPSFIYSDEQQKDLISDCGFVEIETSKVTLDELGGNNISEKLSLIGDKNLPVITVYRAIKSAKTT